MILNGLINVIAAAIRAAIDSALPTGVPHMDWVAGFSVLVGSYKSLNGVLPVDDVMACGAVALIYFTASYAYHGINWLYRHIPFVGGGG